MEKIEELGYEIIREDDDIYIYDLEIQPDNQLVAAIIYEPEEIIVHNVQKKEEYYFDSDNKVCIEIDKINLVITIKDTKEKDVMYEIEI